MQAQRIGFFARLWMGVVLFFKLLFDGALAARVRRVWREMPTGTPHLAAHDSTAALQLLAIMQREGRLIDFLQEDVSSFSDAEVGAAARVVHEGCRRGLAEYVVLEPVWSQREGERIVLERDFDPACTRLTGAVVGGPPFQGRLAHHGWRVAQIRLPEVAKDFDAKIVAPAEVEL